MTILTTQQNEKTVASIAFLVRAELEFHSLNNEENIGNVTQRRVLYYSNGTQTDGVSGGMIKHMHAHHVAEIAKGNKMHLCNACYVGNPVRGGDIECVSCDLHGYMIVSKGGQNKRRSVVESSWFVALPDAFHDTTCTHTRNAISNDDEEGQMIFHRNCRSGIYAGLLVYDVRRIGFDDSSGKYLISQDKRIKKYQVGLDAFEHLLTNFEGATSAPSKVHIGALEGIILVADTPDKSVPKISPKYENYKEQAKMYADMRSIEYFEFNNIVELAKALDILKGRVPYQYN